MDEEVDAFKKEFKRFKRPSEDDMKEIIDFTQPEKFDKILTIQSVVDPPPLGASVSDVQSSCNGLGLTLPSEWKVYSLKTVPGLLFITNPFLCGGQHYWIQKCLLQYPLLPNVTNLDSHISRTGSGQIWPKGDSPVSVHKDSLLYKLRWVTLGYHYDWTSKLYHKEHQSPFPSDLSLLSRFILSSVGFPDFKAEAAIVNYYHFESTLSGHTDHSEADLTSPLISLSFGQSAIFLIGGHTKSVPPLALKIRSGDIIIMSKESRLAYHGIPKILRPAGDDNPIPYCLSREALLKRREIQKDNTKCSLCGARLIERENSLKRGRSEKEDSKGEGEDNYCSKRKALIDEQLSSSKTQEPNIESPSITIQTDTLCNSTDNTVSSKETDEGRDFICRDCEWLHLNWTDIECYMNYSRININVRQVGEIK